jgi:U3 small nucleolar RNA-associated protein 18
MFCSNYCCCSVSAVKFGDMSISCASFLGNSSSSSEVVLSGRKPYFYSYDVTSGAMNKITGLMGKGLKSHEVMVTSPLGTRIAFAGHGGYVHIVCGRMKTWQMDLKMNTPCRSIVFIDEDTIASSGLGEEHRIDR